MIIQDETYLRQVSTEVTENEIENIRSKLLQEAELHPESIGLAAIQIGIPKRAFLTIGGVREEVFAENELTFNDKWINISPKFWDLWINPKIFPEDIFEINQVDSLMHKIGYNDNLVSPIEGCLSFPNRLVKTTRYKQITVSADRVIKINYKASSYSQIMGHQFVLTGMDSIVFQHEFDHINGVLFFDRGQEVFE